MITTMIEKLRKEGNDEVEEKAYCDEEVAKTESEGSEMDATDAKLTSKIDQTSARSTVLKDEVKERNLPAPAAPERKAYLGSPLEAMKQKGFALRSVAPEFIVDVSVAQPVP